MNAGRLILLLIAAGIGTGVLLAAATSHGLRHIRHPHARTALSEAMPGDPGYGYGYAPPPTGREAGSFWMNESLTAWDMPAWLLDQAEGDGSDDPDVPGWADGTGDRGDRGEADYGRDIEPDMASRRGAPPHEDALAAMPVPETILAPDAAADAAMRAGAAAADVIAAERAKN